MISFGEWAPDRANTSDPTVLAKCINAQPKVGGYGPTASLFVAPTATALPAAPRGGASGVDASGVYQAFIGTQSTIELLTSTFTYTTPGTGFNLGAGDNWSMSSYGKFMLATNRTDGVQAYDMDAGGVFAAVTDAPDARILFPAFGAVFAGDCNGVNTLLLNSAIQDHTNWTTGAAGYQRFQEGEEIVGGCEVARGVALLFQRNAIRVLVFDSQNFYNQEILAKEQGAVNPDCIVPVKGGAYIIDTDGFYFVTPGGVTPIGAGRVDEEFISRLAANGFNSVQGAYDPSRHRVLWRYQRSDVASETVFEDIIAYDTRYDRFYEIEETTTFILNMSTPGIVLDAMDGYGPLDQMVQIPLDSRHWFGGEPRLGGVDENLKFGFFDGPNLAATFETTTTENATRVHISKEKPVSDATDITIEIGQSDELSDPLTWTSGRTKQRGGLVPIRADGKNLRHRMTIAAADPTFTMARGISDVVGNGGGPK